MDNYSITFFSDLNNFLPYEIAELLELIIVFFSLYGLIIILLMTSKDNNFFRNRGELIPELCDLLIL